MHGVKVDGFQIHNAALDGFGHLTAGQHCTRHLKNSGDDERLPHSQRARTNRGAKGVSNVITTNVERHKNAKRNGSNENNLIRLRANIVERPKEEGDEGDNQEATKA